MQILGNMSTPVHPFMEYLGKDEKNPQFSFQSVSYTKDREALDGSKTKDSKDCFDINIKIMKTIKNLFIVSLKKLSL